ncbi:hypothetical protein GCM10010170_100020 [Dactylosporangium salmoneum]|uniref:Uncharacterized protein n=1 Tax=Dactylosporangium salmoneum TaxID=53361 RepID=A0ABN3HWR2_9ACTN
MSQRHRSFDGGTLSCAQLNEFSTDLLQVLRSVARGITGGTIGFNGRSEGFLRKGESLTQFVELARRAGLPPRRQLGAELPQLGQQFIAGLDFGAAGSHRPAQLKTTTLHGLRVEQRRVRLDDELFYRCGFAGMFGRGTGLSVHSE